MRKLILTLLGIAIASIAYGATETTSPYGLDDPPYITVAKPTPGNTYYVDPAGSGSGVGSEGDPFATLEEAASKPVVAGDLIYVKAGTYGPISWSTDGASGNEIVIEAFGDGEAIFEATGTSRNYVIADWVIFDGGADRELIFDGSGLDSSQSTLSMTAGGSACIVSRCEIRNANLTAGGGATINVQLDSSGVGHKIYNCLIHNGTSVGVYAINGTDIEIRNNIIRDNWGAGVQCNPHSNPDEVSDLIVSGNLIFGNGFLRTAGVRPGITYLGNFNTIYTHNNILWNNKDISSFAGTNAGYASSIPNHEVYNNTIYNNVDGGVRFNEGRGATFDIQNNIVYSNGATNWDTRSGDYIAEGDAESVNNLTTDPTFVSTTVTDSKYLNISSSSTGAYESGSTLPTVTVDYYNTARTAPYDIGAHEASTALSSSSKSFSGTLQ